jgi:hypothetical protein
MNFSVAVALTSCNTVTTDQYEATAQTRLTWQVKYSIDSSEDKNPRFEEFASNSLNKRNGEKPEDAVTLTRRKRFVVVCTAAMT